MVIPISTFSRIILTEQKALILSTFPYLVVLKWGDTVMLAIPSVKISQMATHNETNGPNSPSLPQWLYIHIQMAAIAIIQTESEPIFAFNSCLWLESQTDILNISSLEYEYLKYIYEYSAGWKSLRATRAAKRGFHLNYYTYTYFNSKITFSFYGE